MGRRHAVVTFRGTTNIRWGFRSWTFAKIRICHEYVEIRSLFSRPDRVVSGQGHVALIVTSAGNLVSTVGSDGSLGASRLEPWHLPLVLDALDRFGWHLGRFDMRTLPMDAG